MPYKRSFQLNKSNVPKHIKTGTPLFAPFDVKQPTVAKSIKPPKFNLHEQPSARYDVALRAMATTSSVGVPVVVKPPTTAEREKYNQKIESTINIAVGIIKNIRYCYAQGMLTYRDYKINVNSKVEADNLANIVGDNCRSLPINIRLLVNSAGNFKISASLKINV